MSNEPANVQIAELLRSGSYAKALAALVQEGDHKAVVARIKDTVATRKKKLAEAMKSQDPEVLVPLQDKMQHYVDSVARIEMTEPRRLTEDEAQALMREYVDRREIDEFLEVRREAMKQAVFAAIDFDAQEKGLDPEVTGGEIVVPEFGKVFKKEGAGRTDPSLDEKKLRKFLGDRVDLVFKEEIIPEQRVEVLDEEALMQLAQDDPTVMEAIREALVPGKPKSARFVVRDIKEEE